MTTNSHKQPQIAIACGGTGGHLFPGLAVARELASAGCEVTLLVSEKEVDKKAVQNLSEFRILFLPAVGLTRGGLFAFSRGFLRSFARARRYFVSWSPDAVLAMGGFTSAPPIVAGKFMGAATFLHESNAFPGRANRYLARIVDSAFLGFEAAQHALPTLPVTLTGTPVRAEFQARDRARAWAGLNLTPNRPLLLVMGGSQGASGINRCVVDSLDLLARQCPLLQYVHLTGEQDCESVRAAYASRNLSAIVEPFSARMPNLMAAATSAISRSGASSLAELAAMRLPSILIPYPAATDNHQVLNGQNYANTGAAIMIEQHKARPAELVQLITRLTFDDSIRSSMQKALENWHAPGAAARIAGAILNRMPAASARPGLTTTRQVMA